MSKGAWQAVEKLFARIGAGQGVTERRLASLENRMARLDSGEDAEAAITSAVRRENAHQKIAEGSRATVLDAARIRRG